MINRRKYRLLRKSLAVFLLLIFIVSSSTFANEASDQETGGNQPVSEKMEDEGEKIDDETDLVAFASSEGETFQSVDNTEVEIANEETVDAVDEIEDEEAVLIMSQTKAKNKTVKLYYNKTIKYENYKTHDFIAECDGKKIVTYCIEPKKNWGGEGKYTANPYNAKLMTKALYYSYANPGYDKYMKPYLAKVDRKKCYTGTKGIYALCHIMLSYVYDGEGKDTDAFKGCSSDTKKVVKNMLKKVKSWPDVPAQPKIGIEMSSSKARWDEDNRQQVSPTIKVIGTSGNSIKVSVPKDTVLEKDGNSYDSGSVKVKVGESYVITANDSKRGTYKSSSMEGSLKGFQPYIIKPSGKQKQVFSVRTINNVSYSFDWVKFGKIQFLKKSADESLTYGNDYYSFKEARYELYRKNKNKPDGGDLYGELVTDEEGRASMGDLPYGDYFIRETSAPQGYELDTSRQDIRIDREETSIEVKDKPLMPLLKTEAGERDTREKDIEENSNVKILDMVQYSNVIPEKEIRIEGRLMDKDTGEEIPGATSQIEFTPVGESGAIEMEYDLDGQDMAGKTIVAFEKMYYEDNLIAAHEDINDEDQSVNIVKRVEPTTEVDRTEANTVKPTPTKPNATELNSPETGDKIDIMLIVLIGIMSVLIALVVLRRRSMKQ